MENDELERELFRQLRSRLSAPRIDIAVRVSETIRGLPPRPLLLHRWTMAVCAALCATAAAVALIATLSRTTPAESRNAAGLVIDAYEVEVPSLLR
jgi:hypothetical protein